VCHFVTALIAIKVHCRRWFSYLWWLTFWGLFLLLFMLVAVSFPRETKRESDWNVRTAERRRLISSGDYEGKYTQTAELWRNMSHNRDRVLCCCSMHEIEISSLFPQNPLKCFCGSERISPSVDEISAKKPRPQSRHDIYDTFTHPNRRWLAAWTDDRSL
jgi:hypothetical protein